MSWELVHYVLTVILSVYLINSMHIINYYQTLELPMTRVTLAHPLRMTMWTALLGERGGCWTDKWRVTVASTLYSLTPN